MISRGLDYVGSEHACESSLNSNSLTSGQNITKTCGCGYVRTCMSKDLQAAKAGWTSSKPGRTVTTCNQKYIRIILCMLWYFQFLFPGVLLSWRKYQIGVPWALATFWMLQVFCSSSNFFEQPRGLHGFSVYVCSPQSGFFLWSLNELHNAESRGHSHETALICMFCRQHFDTICLMSLKLMLPTVQWCLKRFDIVYCNNIAYCACSFLIVSQKRPRRPWLRSGTMQ